jgi:uncharacterized protein
MSDEIAAEPLKILPPLAQRDGVTALAADLREWVERRRPAWLLHGHTLPDPARCVCRLGETRVVHVGGAKALELGQAG